MKELSDISIQYLKGVGPVRKKIFNRLGVESIEDLLYFFPRRYEDRRHMMPIAQVKVGESCLVSGEVIKFNGRQVWYTKKHVCRIEISDDTGVLHGVWFNQPFMSNYFQVGQKVIMHGKVDQFKGILQIVSPEYEIIDDDEAEGTSLHIGRIVPIYPLTRGLTQRLLRKAVKAGLDQYAGQVREVLPFSLREKYRLSNLVKSLSNLHYPEDFESQKDSYKRIAFEEFFLFQVSVFLRKLSLVAKKGFAHRINDDVLKEFLNSFDFKLTQAQERVIGEMAKDMAQDSPMHRLLQGDVGSGKTIVAFFGCVMARHNGYQSAIMAPTEILASQHYGVIMKLIEKKQFSFIRAALLTGSTSKKKKEKIYEDIGNGNIDLVVGTHALIQQDLHFKSLSFIVIDEQHKFGVRQRSLFPSKGVNPDTLIMTATPIPRTLCLTLYGDLDVSVIDEMPVGRGQVRTLHFGEDSAPQVYKMVEERVLKGEQAYIVYPIVEESEKLDLKAAEKMYEELKGHEFKNFKVGLIHGQMPKKNAEAAMNDFKNKKIDILVATTVLEVGVDVPNATIMVIEHAPRFGLAQLHQLRGRIGRGSRDSVCVLLADPTTVEGKARIEAILSSNDGFKIAEQDLLIRGPGEFFGRQQHGINELKVANPVTQLDILAIARKEALELTRRDPKLIDHQNQPMRAVIEKRYPTYLEMTGAG